MQEQLKERRRTRMPSCEQTKRHWRLVLSILVLILSLTSLFDDMINGIGRSHVLQQAEEFLKDSERQAQQAFVLLSMGKAEMSVVESSSAGVSFIVDINVQLGSIISPLHDLFNYAWEFTLGSLSILLISQMLLDIVELLFEPYLIFFALFWASYEALKIVNKKNASHLKFGLRTLSILFIFLFLSFPMAIVGTSYLSKIITEEKKQTLTEGIAWHNTLFSGNQESGSLKDNAKSVMTTLKTNRGKVESHVKTMHKYLYTHIAVGVIELFLLPMLLLFLFSYGVKILLPATTIKDTS
jgi:hypothetical protein